MDPFGLAICLVVVCLGSAIQGAIGFGVTFLSAPVLGLLYPDLVPAPLVLMSIPLVALVLWSNRAGVDWRGVSWALAGCAVGAVAAGFTIAALSKQLYELLFGCGLLVAVGMSLLGWRPAIHRGSSILAGLASGFMATTTAIGGPPIALLYQGEEGARLRGSLSAFFLGASFFILPSLYGAGRLGRDELLLSALLLPGVLLGFALSRFFAGRLDERVIRLAVLAVSAAGGCILLGRVLLALQAG